MVDFLKGAIDSALDSKNGHLDLFTRFLVGVSHKSSRDILQGILESAISNSESPQKLIVFIKNLKRKTLSPERCINLIHCLLQLKDDSILQKDNRVSSKTQLTPFQSTFLAYKFIISEKPEEFNFRNNKTSDDVFYRLTPALRACTTALLNFCHITPEKCATVAWVLQASSRLTVLDLGHNDLGDAGVRRLCDGLRNPNCKVETLNLSYNNVGTRGVEELCTVLTPNSKLLTLDLSGNDFGNSGLKFLVNSLRGGCTLQVLRLSGCSITSSEDVNSARVLSNTFQMKGLDLTYNPFRDTGYPDIPQQLTINDGAESWNRQGLYKYATPMQLALDPDTVNHYLLLSERDRKVIRQKTELQYPETQERFDKCNQVLCKPSLNERHYLEVECLRNAYVGVAYERLKRKGSGDCVKLGHNKDSWTLYTSDSGSHAQHNNISHLLHTPDIKADVPYKVGVFLDWPAGLVSFYLVNNETRIHLYAYYTKFTDPLYFAIRLNTPNATVSLLT
ncbi:hypothetical protein DPEC_G00308220 [Dallia pectoralis]|uniref:Uncharacterized protein n=1 Tax=Dallia pectoralis TaxID=75939 RepID=A0ACC2FEG5_DALPE|nr:hypothetical protein DPEC_G00308220 [Dallia pectoralis]